MQLRSPAYHQYRGSYLQLREAVRSLLDHLPEHVTADEPLKDTAQLARIMDAVNQAHEQFADCHVEIVSAADRLRDVMERRNMEVAK